MIVKPPARCLFRSASRSAYTFRPVSTHSLSSGLSRSLVESQARSGYAQASLNNTIKVGTFQTHKYYSTTSTSPTGSADSFLTSNIYDLLSLKERTVVITGGGRGIGLALAFAVAEAGGNVALIDVAEEPHEHYERLKEICSKLKYYHSDVTVYATLEKTFEQIVGDFGRVDGIITAAGVCPDQPFLERPPESVKRCYDINVLGTYYSAQLAARQMVKQPRLEAASGTGSIVMIASIAAHRSSLAQYTSDYCSSKGAVLSLTKQLGSELAPNGIRVNSISPGYIETDMIKDIARTRPALVEIFKNEPPMKRMGDRTDLKAAAVYLLSDASAYMTGAEMLITGGLHAGKVV